MQTKNPQTNEFKDMFGYIFGNATNESDNKANKQRLETRKKDLVVKFQKATGQAKMNYLMELTTLDSQINSM